MRKFSKLVPLLAALIVASVTSVALANDSTGLVKNLRTIDGRLAPLDLTTAPQLGEIYLDDGTGETLTSPSTATVVKSSTLTLAGKKRGGVTLSATNAAITVKASGLFRASYCVNDGTGANTATVTFDVYEKIGSGSAASIGKGARSKAITLTAAPWVPMCGSALIEVSAADAASNAIFDVRATASTGNLVVKAMNLQVVKIDELQPPTA